jgi:hypothetical protein
LDIEIRIKENSGMKIVYVIGAGASAEIGMPIGKDLKKQISALLSNERDELRRLDLEQAAQFGIEAIEINYERIRNGEMTKYQLYDLMIKMVRALEYDVSIDNFLYNHQNNEAYQIFGKTAIFSTILKAEKKSALWTDVNNREYTPILENTWYLSLFQQLIRQATLNTFVNRLNDIQFITFNYDRSLEFYLFHSIQRSYEVASEKAAEIMSNIKIYHPYGQGGSLPYQKGPLTFDYGAFQKYTENNLAQYLKTYTEGTDIKAEDYKKAMFNLYEAEKVVFLGFAFHQQNIDLLYKLIDVWKEQRKLDKINTFAISNYYATFFETSQDNIKETEKQLRKSNDRIKDFKICERKCVDLFSEYSKALEIY